MKDLKHIILHIPHSSTLIPLTDGFVVPTAELEKEINLLTDWFTDKIFDIPGLDKLVTPFSRLFCDVERFPDDSQEVMASRGMGFAYTHGTSGQKIREVDQDLKAKILNEYYQPHHDTLNKLVAEKLAAYGKVLIIDCHSFPSTPLACDLYQSIPRPEISIGADPFHTPSDMVEDLLREQERFNTKVNDPYSGTIVPLDYYGKDSRVQSVMIELNRSLYMHESADAPSKRTDFYKAKGLALEIVNFLGTFQQQEYL